MMKLLVLGICIVLTAFCAGIAMGSVAIAVDASKPIGPVNPIWQDFAQGGESADPDYLRPLIEPMRALKPRLIRFDHVLNHYTKVVVKDGKMAVDFTALDKQLDVIRAMGAQPLMCLSFTPAALGGDKGVTNPPNDLRLWHELIYRLVKHVNVDRKLGVEYWEIWNEPNLKAFWTGNMSQFLELYAVTEKAVIRADPSVKFGGAGYYGFPDDWVRAMMEQAKSRNLRMDFVSWHLYKDWQAGVGKQVGRARAWMDELGLKSELIVDEWNYNAMLDPGNDDNNGAVCIADLICRMTEAGIDRAPFFEIKDGANKKRYWGRWGLFTADHHPKASYYAFVGFAHMEGDRLSFSGEKVIAPDENVNKGEARIGGVAVGKGKRLDVVLYNTSLKQDETVDLTISGLGRSAVKARTFLIDATHSNPALTGRETGLEQVDERTLRSDNGTVRMQVSLPKRSVAFVRM
jgi:hypothetical protein